MSPISSSGEASTITRSNFARRRPSGLGHALPGDELAGVRRQRPRRENVEVALSPPSTNSSCVARPFDAAPPPARSMRCRAASSPTFPSVTSVMPGACSSSKKRWMYGRRRSRSTSTTLRPARVFGECQVRGRRRLSLLLDRALVTKITRRSVALERSKLEVRAQHPEGLRALAGRLRDHHELVLFASRFGGGGTAGQQLQAEPPATSPAERTGCRGHRSRTRVRGPARGRAPGRGSRYASASAPPAPHHWRCG